MRVRLGGLGHNVEPATLTPDKTGRLSIRGVNPEGNVVISLYALDDGASEILNLNAPITPWFTIEISDDAAVMMKQFAQLNHYLYEKVL